MNTFLRWSKFNLVGAVGMAVQLGALAILNRMWPGHCVIATAAALELTLVHNFVWHLNFTWRDRFPTLSAQPPHGRRPVHGGPGDALRMGHPNGCGIVAGQLIKFHLANGLISMIGNLALMPVLVEGADIPVVAANAIAILCCSIVNFCLGNDWVFAARAEVKQNQDAQGVDPKPDLSLRQSRKMRYSASS